MTLPAERQVPAVFIDRDGTLMHDADYCSDPKQVQVFQGAPEALRRLRNRNYKLIIITNQAGSAAVFSQWSNTARSKRKCCANSATA